MRRRRMDVDNRRRVASIALWVCLILFAGTFPVLLLLSPWVGILPCIVFSVVLVAAILVTEGLEQYYKQESSPALISYENGLR